MCGRYASTRSAADLAELFGVEDLTEGDLVPDYNVAPTDPAPIVLAAGEPPEAAGAAVLRVARWGFLPPWSRDASSAARMINARSETVASSRAFGEAFLRRRCLVPADGWYEWRVRSPGVKQPYFMTRPGPVVFGGVWSRWGTGAEFRTTFSIITMPAAGALATVHDRMPLLLDESRWADWLSGSDPLSLLTPPRSEYCDGFEIRPVSAAVGDVRKDGPELLRRVTIGDIDMSTVDIAPTLF
jgi:putative SOS response-associated peptidase YedK